MSRFRILLLACAVAAGAMPGPGAHGAPPPGVDPAGAAATIVAGLRHPWMRWPDLTDVAADLALLYAAENDGLVWLTGGGEEPSLAGALDAAARAAERGLEPGDYDADRLAAERTRLAGPEAPAADRAAFDVAVSAGVLRQLGAVARGRVDPRAVGWGYTPSARPLDRVALVRQVREGRGVSAVLDGLEPAFPHYARNRRELARYLGLAHAGEPLLVPAVAKGRKVEPGRPWAGVTALRARLVVLGDLAEAGAPAAAADGTPFYDAGTVAAVKRFQARHVLEADGVVGAATVEALNVPLARRARQLALALERGRWLPPLSERPTVFVNVPLFRLWASDPVRGEEPLRMNVVVGKAVDHRTPIFLEEMEYVVFRPYWNPPPSIVRSEIVPHARRDASYLAREDMEIVAEGSDRAPALAPTAENLDAVLAGRLFVRQRPGPRNSLGLAKFIFPNHENVYMHGTPAQALFARTRRDFSHGCIRLEDPARLAAWVLRDDPGWTRARIDAAMQGERPTQVNLRPRLRVAIFYDTVHVNSEGVVHFAADIYGHDQALDRALARGYPYPAGG